MTKMKSNGDKSSRKSSRVRDRLWTPVFIFIVASSLTCFVGGQGINSGTTLFLSLTGGSAVQAGYLALVFSFTAAIGRLLCGPYVDRTGPTRVMIGGSVVFFVGMAAPLLTYDEPFMTIWRALQGIGFSLVSTAGATAAAEVLPESRLGEGIGYFSLGQALSMAFGPALALFLVYMDPPTNLYVGLTAFTLLTLLFSFLCRYENYPERLPKTSAFRRKYDAALEYEHAVAHTGDLTDTLTEAELLVRMSEDMTLEPSEQMRETAEKALKHATRNGDTHTAVPLEKLLDHADPEDPKKTSFWKQIFEKRALCGFLPMVILTPAFGFGIFFVALYGDYLGVSNTGLFFFFAALMMIAVRLGSGLFMDKVAPIKIYTVAVAAGFISFLLLLGADTIAHSLDAVAWFYFLSAPFYGLCLGAAVPINQTVAVKNTPPERWGAANALFLLAPDLGNGISAPIWGALNESIGFPFTLSCVLGCIVVSYIVSWLVYPASAKRRPEPEQSS